MSFQLALYEVKPGRDSPSQALLIIKRRLPMYHYIGIDVSKKALAVFDGRK